MKKADLGVKGVKVSVEEFIRPLQESKPVTEHRLRASTLKEAILNIHIYSLAKARQRKRNILEKCWATFQPYCVSCAATEIHLPKSHMSLKPVFSNSAAI